MLYKVVLTFEFVDETQSMTIQMNAIKQYLSTVLFILVFYVTKFQVTVSVFKFVPRSTLKCMLVPVKNMKKSASPK